MNKTKTGLVATPLVIGVVFFGSQTRLAEGAEVCWLASFKQAQAQSWESDKPILADFTGSDWWIRLDAEVFSTEEFGKYATEKLVLVKVDFSKKKLSSALRRQNISLARRFGVEALPTLVVLSYNGKQLGRMGYRPGGPEPFLGQLNRLTSVKRIN